MMKPDFLILMADNDEDDCLLASSAFVQAGIADKQLSVTDGRELMEYLYGQGSFSDPEQFPRPDLIFLDLNMSRKDGREALLEVKSDPDLSTIP